MAIVPLKTVASNAIRAASKHSPEILTGIATCGVVSTVVLAVKATPKALSLLDETFPNRNDETENKPKPIDVIKVAWKCYIPAAISGATTIGLIIASNRISAKRAAVLASLYTMSEKALNEYKGTVKETLGQKAADKVSSAVAGKKLEETPKPVDPTDVIPTGLGSSLCFDTMSGRYFLSSMDALKRAENEVISFILHSGSASLNEFYDVIGLEHTKIGDDVGWNLDKAIALHFESKLAEDGTPCLVMDYTVEPSFAYGGLF